MHPFSPALAAEIERKTALLCRTEPGRVDAGELERAISGALGELRRTRPRIVEFAPRQAMQRVLQAGRVRALLDRPGDRFGLGVQEPSRESRRSLSASPTTGMVPASPA